MTRAAALLAALALACSAGRDGSAGGSPEGEPARDPADPRAALAVGAEEAAARLGSFEWAAAVSWSVEPPQRSPSVRVRAAERHRVRQSATGEFEVENEIDPGEGPGSETGRDVVFAGGATYARSRWAPARGAFRVRSADRGHEARRIRDETFGIPAEIAGLCGAGLRFEPAGEGKALGRRARRYRISLLPGVEPGGRPRLAAARPDGGPDDDTRRRLAFLDGRVPVRAEGQLLVDAETGVPLETRLAAAFEVREEVAARVEVTLEARVKALGPSVPAVAPPESPLPDERKPRGVAQALEAAGFKKAREPEKEREPAEESE